MLFGPDLRASDADREAAVEFLKHHYEAGRLDHEELQDRVDAAYAARYESELARLTRDLPPLRRGARVQRVRRSGGARTVATGGAVAFGALVLATVPPVAMVLVAVTAVTLLLAAGILMGPLILSLLVVVWALRALSRHTRGGLPRGPGGHLGR